LRISALIAALEALRATEGDLVVTFNDEERGWIPVERLVSLEQAHYRPGANRTARPHADRVVTIR